MQSRRLSTHPLELTLLRRLEGARGKPLFDVLFDDEEFERAREERRADEIGAATTAYIKFAMKLMRIEERFRELKVNKELIPELRDQAFQRHRMKRRLPGTRLRYGQRRKRKGD